MTKRIISGIQSTGILHLGNYLGAIKQFVQLQHDYETLLFMADLHSITLPQDPDALRNSTRHVAAGYIACGIDLSKVTIFAQSSIPHHTELAWILSCNTPMGWLNRMTQFKEKAGKEREGASTGLFTYPVLQAADILLYHADIVPVGEDQKQHIELTRDIALAFNRHVKRDYFIAPEPYIMGHATRVMSLRDGTKKMSKSDESDYSRINLTDDADVIAKKMQKAKSDSIMGISYDKEQRPEVSNLINIFASLSNLSQEQVCVRFETLGSGAFKKELAEIAVAHLAPISSEIGRLCKDPGYLDQVLAAGKERATAIAYQTISQVKEMVGFVRV